jgi:UDP-N-acetylglucosamine transferase subunit ALG13
MVRIAEILSEGKVSGEAVLIFLTVGSWYKGFDRLVEAVDDLRGRGVIADEVVAQIGPGSYRPKNMQVMDYCSPSDFQERVAEARVVISHAGMGTIAEAVSARKPVIVVPRKASLGEHFDDHQFSTAEQMEKEGLILVAREIEDLPARLEMARTFVPAETRGSEEILKAVEEFVERIAANKGRRRH